MSSRDVIYAVARIHYREMALLTKQDLEQLLACRSYDECLRSLKDKGWGRGSERTGEAILEAEEEKIWELMGELTEDLSPFRVLMLPTDYNNLKAAIKCVDTSTEPVDVFLPGGTLEPEALLQCARESDFSSLPEHMRQAADEAHHLLLETGNGQLCDILLDKACLQAIQAEGKSSKEDLPARYAELTVAIADIKTAVRAAKTGKDQRFLETALAPCDSLNIQELTAAACKGSEALFEYLSGTPYAQAAQELRESYSAFEKWCDNHVMEMILPEKSNFLGMGPLFAYVLARRSEIASVRIILSGKLNGLDETMIRQRVRDTYV